MFSLLCTVSCSAYVIVFVGVQRSIEGILKEKVRNNYGMFLQATELIHKVGVEMADLKHIVDNTQKLINVSAFLYAASRCAIVHRLND